MDLSNLSLFGAAALFRRVIGLMLLIFASASIYADPTPLDQPLVEDAINEIKVVHRQAEEITIGRDKGMSDPGEYTYKVYVPPGYNDPANADLAYPCLFICNGGGNPQIKLMDDFVRDNGWIVVLVTDAKNGPWGPIYGAFFSAHDDAMKRLRIRNGLKMAAGASGGAGMTGYGITMRRGFVAWMPVIGSAPSSRAARMKGLIVYGLFGRQDGRVKPDYVKGFIKAFKHLPMDWTTHSGGHSWGEKEGVAYVLTQVRNAVMNGVKLSEAEAAHMLKPLVEAYEAEGTLIGRKHGLADRITGVAKRGRLTRADGWAEKLEAMEAYLKSFRKDKQLKQELKAYEAWQSLQLKLRKLEDFVFIGEVDAADVPKYREKFEQDIKELAEKYPGTEVAEQVAQ